ncbi:tripartite tricarboxylate transporter substrate binding protein [Citricoccus sp. GCM10030269]|uniref:tripartite tricarboxylate transporter substrate binding protein n=1 Tax=Citricoccus sp. GCM10030269 TaxID=3273388 RepID=UPI0036090ADB
MSRDHRPTTSRRTTLASMAALALSGLLLTGCADNAGGGSNASGEDNGNAAEEFPTQDIRLVVPWAAGGSGDLSARTIAPLLEDELGVSVVVENRPGANGSVAYNWLKEQEPDGYNLSMLGAEVATLQFMDYDIKPDDYAFLGKILEGPGAIAVKADSPYETLEDLIDAAKESPGELTYSSPGVGSVWDNPAQGLQEMAGIELTNVPYDGSAPSIAAAAAGDVDFSIDAMGSQKAQVDGGELRYLAVLTEERVEEYPDVPTAKEQGVDLQNASFTGLMAPAGTPEPVVQKLSDAISSAAQHEDYTSVIEQSNLVPVSESAEEFTEFIQAEEERYGPWIELAKSKQG